MPIVPKITGDYSARGLETWGISDEKVKVVKEWLAGNSWCLLHVRLFQHCYFPNSR